MHGIFYSKDTNLSLGTFILECFRGQITLVIVSKFWASLGRKKERGDLDGSHKLVCEPGEGLLKGSSGKQVLHK